MKVNIYTSLNGVGLERDYILMRDILESAGHEVGLSDYKARQGGSDCHVAFHLEIPRQGLLRYSKKNIIIPNAEWFAKRWIPWLRHYNEIWCKTQDAVTIYSQYHKNVVRSGFTSDDVYNPDVKRDRCFVHVAGQSLTKGTKALIEAYRNNKDLPRCFLISSNADYLNGCTNDLIPCNRLKYDDLKIMLNSCLFHICTSEYEGWGHYLHEALSCGAVVITTDSPPMNEFVTDSRCLVPEYGKIPMGIANRKLINSQDLADKIRGIAALKDSEIDEIGKANREGYLGRCDEFKTFLLKYINEQRV